MNILFLNANLYGHINPTLGLVKKLTEQGNQVNYFCAEPFAEQITKAGAKWIGYSDQLEVFLKEYRPTDRHPFYMLMEYMLSYDEVVLPDILKLIEEQPYDMIICDSYFGGACFLEKITTIPVICSHSSFAMSKTPVPERMLMAGFHPQLDYCYEILRKICERYRIETPSMEQVFTSKGELNIVYTAHNFNGDGGVHEPDYLFAGPALDRLQEPCDLDFTAAEGKKIIYISLGSINTNFANFYKMCITAFRETNYYVFMSIGSKIDLSQLGEVPSNFMIKSFLPQLAVLEKADVFITHAGFNSVNEALCFGVPMLALPLVNDQHMVAKRVADLRLGIMQDMNTLTQEILTGKVEILVSDKKFRNNCMNYSYEIKKYAKLEQVVCKIEEYVRARKEK